MSKKEPVLPREMLIGAARQLAETYKGFSLPKNPEESFKILREGAMANRNADSRYNRVMYPNHSR